MRVYWIDNLKSGELGMMARPRGGDWLEDEIKSLKHRKIDIVVSLLESDEIYELGIENEENFCIQNNIQFINFPIQDRNIPSKENEFLELIDKLSLEIEKSKKIVVHCRMGIGRTSLLIAGILVKNGFNSNQVFDYLSKIRTLEVPDTNEQIN